MNPDAPSRFLDVRALAALERFRFTPMYRAEGVYSGRHRSRRRGGAGEFVDYREYTEGEDLRRLDWKVLGRTGRGYIRLYQDETNLVCTYLIDASESMRFREQSPVGSKLEYAQYLGTALSHIIGRQQDQFALATVDGELRHYLAPGGTPSHIAEVQRTIERIDTQPVTALSVGLRQLFQRSRRRGVLLLASDFLEDDLEAVIAAIRLFRHSRWEIVVLHLVHPEEERLPEGGSFRFVGLENDGIVDCSPFEIATTYHERFSAHLAGVRTLAMATGCDYRRISTGVNYLRTLSGFLVERMG